MPIQRSPYLQPLSRDHHHTLLLSWKIRTGLKKEVSPERILDYCRAYYRYALDEHFSKEEEYLFPLLDADNRLVHQALAEHRKVRKLIVVPDPDPKTVLRLEELLEKHVRFEERVLFNVIQEQVPEYKLAQVMEAIGEHKPEMEWHDPFWE